MPVDLDFAAPREDLALAVLEALDGAKIDGFAFAIKNLATTAAGAT